MCKVRTNVEGKDKVLRVVFNALKTKDEGPTESFECKTWGEVGHFISDMTDAKGALVIYMIEEDWA